MDAVNKTKKDVLKGALGKVKLVDAGTKSDYGPSSVKSSETSAPRINYPCLYLSTDAAPMLAGCDVGSEITLLVKAAVTGHSLRERTGSDKSENYDLEIRKIGVVNTS